MDSSFFSQKMPYYLLTLLVYVYGSAFRPLKAKYYETKEFLKSQPIAHVFFKVTFRGQISCSWISKFLNLIFSAQLWMTRNQTNQLKNNLVSWPIGNWNSSIQIR